MHNVKKVCMIFPFEFPSITKWEGSRSRLMGLSQELLRRKIEINVLCKKDAGYILQDFRGLKIHNTFNIRNKEIGYFLAPLLFAGKALQLRRLFNIDIFHAHMPLSGSAALILKKMADCKVVYDAHDWFLLRALLYYDLPFLPSSLSNFVDSVERSIAGAADGIIITTPLLRGTVTRFSGNSKVFVIPNGVDVKLFRPEKSDRREEIFPKSPLVIGYLGIVGAWKGCDEFIKAMKTISLEIKGAKAIVIGGGDIEPAKTMARSLGMENDIYFTGKIPKVSEMLNIIDIGVSPFQRAYSPICDFYQPLKLLEYMSCQKPVVVTPLNEQRRIVYEANAGVVAEGFTYEHIAKAILTLYKSGSMDDKGKCGRDYVEKNHSYPVLVDRLLDAYSEIIR